MPLCLSDIPKSINEIQEEIKKLENRVLVLREAQEKKILSLKAVQVFEELEQERKDRFGKRGEYLAMTIAKRLGIKLMEIDYEAFEEKLKWFCIEAKYRYMHFNKSRNFKGFGMDNRRINKYLEHQKRTGARTLLMNFDPSSDKEEGYIQWLDVLENKGHGITYLSDNKLYPLSDYIPLSKYETLESKGKFSLDGKAVLNKLLEKI